MERCRACASYENSSIGTSNWRELYPAQTDYEIANFVELLKHWKINIDSKDGLGQKICEDCYAKFVMVQKFRERCTRAYNNMQKTKNIPSLSCRGVSPDVFSDAYKKDPLALRGKEKRNQSGTKYENDTGVINLRDSQIPVIKISEPPPSPLPVIDISDSQTIASPVLHKLEATSSSMFNVVNSTLASNMPSILDVNKSDIPAINSSDSTTSTIIATPIILEPQQISKDNIQWFSLSDLGDLQKSIGKNASKVTINIKPDMTDVIEYGKEDFDLDVIEVDIAEKSLITPEHILANIITENNVTDIDQESYDIDDLIEESSNEFWPQNEKIERQKIQPNLRGIWDPLDDIKPNPLLCRLCLSDKASDLLYATVEDLKEHQQQVHSDPEKTAKCLLCNEFFIDWNECQSHYNNNHTIGYNCPKCGNFYRGTSTTVRRHARIHNRTDYTCEICGLKFTNTTKASFEQHKRWHDTKNIIKCTQEGCKKFFISNFRYNRHLARHNKKFNFVCSACGKGFFQKTEFHKHEVNNHGKESKVKCNFCPETFTTLSNKANHMRKKHSDKHTVSCNVCNKTFMTHKELLTHNHLAHVLKVKQTPDTPESYRCKHCSKLYHSSSSLALHQVKHTPHASRPFACSECYSFFKEAYALRVHYQNCHSGEKPFECEVCGRKFVLRKVLKQHMGVHNHKFKCDLCPRSYSIKKSLMEHKQTYHEKIRKYPCDYCDCMFFNRTPAIDHMKKAHASHYFGNVPAEQYEQ